MQKIETYDVIVVGGGASGMMAAGKAGAMGKRVLLIEKNKTLGQKLRITGGGRCNVTNATYDTRTFLQNYGTAGAFLPSPFSQFGVKDTFTFFENLGLPLVVQARNRAFPKTEKAVDVLNALLKYMKQGKVSIMSGTPVKKIIHKDGKVEGVVAGGVTYKAKSYILATGGVSHPETGSTGDGFDWLRGLGHIVKTPTPSIVPIEVSDTWVHKLSGRALANMKITFYLEGKKQLSLVGRILFTHFGLSGPLILNNASKVGDWLQSGTVTATIDAFPELDIGALDHKLTEIFDQNKNKILKNILKDIAPDGTAPGISMLLSELDMETKVHSITKAQRRKIVDTLKALPIQVTNLMGYDKAVVADGGVVLKEIDTKTMRSKLFANLFITGDLLDINRPSGGYSLQICWTSGFVAGMNA
ncbi:MAG: aminoacetone oxidase family FAD-binding enzyme [Candidatus Pacebacteria bacterium]|nr:aminoacetone oxidase family FAD-binding enzyme [Candidatus Paceibacterota bacterium]MBP9851286.1 aminoacetone oxidase family FAD-binding enzyme [Candidatus Paceibacterota bacterium]